MLQATDGNDDTSLTWPKTSGSDAYLGLLLLNRSIKYSKLDICHWQLSRKFTFDLQHVLPALDTVSFSPHPEAGRLSSVPLLPPQYIKHQTSSNDCPRLLEAARFKMCSRIPSESHATSYGCHQISTGFCRSRLLSDFGACRASTSQHGRRLTATWLSKYKLSPATASYHKNWSSESCLQRLPATRTQSVWSVANGHSGLEAELQLLELARQFPTARLHQGLMPWHGYCQWPNRHRIFALVWLLGPHRCTQAMLHKLL